jgi:hypothetical protein
MFIASWRRSRSRSVACGPAPSINGNSARAGSRSIFPCPSRGSCLAEFPASRGAICARRDRHRAACPPNSTSGINAVEGFFSALTRRRLRPGIFQSVADLGKAIARYIRKHNAASRPFVWAKPADSIVAKLSRPPCTF